MTFKKQIILTESLDGRWLIEESTPDSNWPTVEKPNARDMVARVMQIAKVGPVAPQTHPERIEITLPEETP